MAPGADKVIAFDPPGSIGLLDFDPTYLIRFDETTTAARPRDAFGALQDLDIGINFTVVRPTVVDGVLGRARLFDGATTGLGARDLVPGSTLLTRDVSIQVVLAWNAAGQLAAGQPGTIVSRGLGGSSAEYVAYALQLDTFDAPSSTATLRWFWQDVAGVDRLQAGAQVTIAPGKFTLLTATRRWVSPTQVVLRYYVGDALLSEVTSTNGSIGGGTTGATQVGYRSIGSNGNFLAGTIDELMVVGRELTREEIEATWLRITRYQPLGYRLFLEMHDEGFPMPTDPGSDVQLEARMIGNALGYAAAQAENLRANALPGRAYGSTLEDWETAVRVTPAPAQSIDQRRARVVARLSQRRGVSIGGLEDALAGLLGGAPNSALQFLAFTNTITEDFTTLSTLRWDVTPEASFTAVAGQAHVAPGAGTYLFTGATRAWLHAEQPIGGDGLAAHFISKAILTTPQSGVEIGIYFGDAAHGNYLLLGLRDAGGVFSVVTEQLLGYVSQGVTTRAVLGGNPAAIWFHLFQQSTPGQWSATWSLTSGTAGFVAPFTVTHPTLQNLAGLYLRSTGALGAGPVADFDDAISRAPFGTRPFDAYVFLDSALGFSPDVEGAHSVIQAIKHAYTEGTFITDKVLRCDFIPGCGRGPMGGI